MSYFQPVFEHTEPEKKKAEVKKVVKKKKKVPGKAAEPEDQEDEGSPEKDRPDVPEITTDDASSRKGSRATAPVTIVKEATPEPPPRKNSLEPPQPGSRRGSGNLLSFTPSSSRRGSITFIADEVKNYKIIFFYCYCRIDSSNGLNT